MLGGMKGNFKKEKPKAFRAMGGCGPKKNARFDGP